MAELENISKETLDRLLTAVKAEGFYPCPQCRKVFISQDKLLVHSQRRHIQDVDSMDKGKENTMQNCVSEIQTKESSVNDQGHNRISKKHRPGSAAKDQDVNVALNQLFKCELCPKVFITHDKLSRHNSRRHKLELQTNSEISEVPITLKPACEKCDSSFVSQEPFDQHICTGSNILVKNKANTHVAEFSPFTVDRKENKMDSIMKDSGAKKSKQTEMNSDDVHENASSISNANLCESCSICQASFTSYKQLKKHVKLHGFRIKRTNVQGVQYQCMICQKMVDRKHLKHLVKHSRQESHTHSTENKSSIGSTDNYRYKCLLCGSFFYNKKFIRAHLMNQCQSQRTSDIATNTCLGLGKLADDHQSSEVQDASCVSQMTSEEGSLVDPAPVSHIAADGLPDTPAVITIKNNDTMSSQMPATSEQDSTSELFDTDRKYLRCYECDIDFLNVSDVKKHMRLHRGDKLFPCSICSKLFTTQGSLKTHMLHHSGNFAFRCSICNKGFRANAHLEAHLTKHTGEKPFECPVCQKRFSLAGNLKLHIRYHDGNLFHCNICKKGFISDVDLKVHMRTHTNERPFKCTYCEKAFKHRGDLNMHVMIHTGEKPHSCPLCSRAFRRKSQVKSHMHTHITV